MDTKRREKASFVRTVMRLSAHRLPAFCAGSVILTWGMVSAAATTWNVSPINTGHACSAPADPYCTTIQNAIDGASAGDTISVYPGTYDQDEANGRDPVNGGAGSNDFNIFVDKALTIQGVTAGGVPITDHNNVAAFVVAKRNVPDFGCDAIFVQADGVTITGFDIKGFDAPDGNNKTVEVTGDNFTLKYSQVHALDQTASVYVDDTHYDAGTDTSHVQSYRIGANLLDGGGPDNGAAGVYIANGAGWSGPVSGRVITGNTITNNDDGIVFSGPGYFAWDLYPVGAATISDNSFSISARRHVLAHNTYANLDWAGIVASNTFDKAAIAWTPGGDARSWDLGSFANARGIYSTIQRYAVNKAVAGDTVQVLAGTYDEQVVIDGKSLTLQGAGDTSILQPSAPGKLASVYRYPGGIPYYAGVTIAGILNVKNAGVAGVTVKDLKVDGASVASLPAGAARLAGILYGESAGTIQNVTVDTIKTTGYVDRTYGIDVSAAGSAVSVEVAGNRITDFARNGVMANGPQLIVNIHDNVITGPGSIGPDNVPNGIVLMAELPGANVSGNTIHNCHYNVPLSWRSTGIMMFDECAPGVTIAGNEVYDVDDGVNTYNECIIQGNYLHGNGSGVVLEAGAYGNQITCNRIEDNTVDGIQVNGVNNPNTEGQDPPGPNNTAHNNTIVDNAIGAQSYDTSQTFDATGNWWGCAAGPGSYGCDTVTAGVDASSQAPAPPTCVNCGSAADCDDAVACNGAETCNPSTHMCQAGRPVVCSEPCHIGICTEPDGTCDFTTLQPDGASCNIADTCQAGVCTGALMVKRARLTITLWPTLKTGSVAVSGQVDDSDTGGDLKATLVANLVTVQVQDNSDVFDTTISLTGCHLGRRGVILCKSSDRTTTARFTPLTPRRTPNRYLMSVVRKKLAFTDTGYKPLMGPAMVTLHQSKVTRVGTASTCKLSRLKTTLVCKAP